MRDKQNSHQVKNVSRRDDHIRTIKQERGPNLVVAGQWRKGEREDTCLVNVFVEVGVSEGLGKEDVGLRPTHLKKMKKQSEDHGRGASEE